VALTLTVGGAVPLRAGSDDCKPIIEDFTRAIDAGSEADAQTAMAKLALSAECERYQLAAQRRLAVLRLSAVHLLMARDWPVADYDRMLIAAEAPELLWQASATLGQVRFTERRFAEAAQAYDRAIEIVKNEALTPVPPARAEIEGLIDRAGQARLLAANGAGADGGQFVQTSRDQRDGTLGGIYSRSVRGIVPRAVPIPITFEYRTARLTSVGVDAARELVNVLREQAPPHLVLVGHTDARGTAEFNMRLSRERAGAVAAFLQQNGIAIPVDLIGKGATEPLPLDSTSGLTQEEIYALNRRVEWRRE